MERWATRLLLRIQRQGVGEVRDREGLGTVPACDYSGAGAHGFLQGATVPVRRALVDGGSVPFRKRGRWVGCRVKGF